NLLDKGKLRRAAVLLFGKNPKQFYITAYIKIGKFVSATDLISTDDIEGNIFDQVDKAIEILRIKYLLSNITYEGIYRKDNMEYPEEALREAIINAVIHRNYMGAHTQLRIDPESLNLWNEGGLPPGIGVADLKKWHLSRPRNELLADVFFKAGMIEAWGRGTIKIVDECKKAGLPEPEFREQFGGLSVHFRKAEKAQEAQVGAQLKAQSGARSQAQSERILFILSRSEASARELLSELGLKSKTGYLKRDIKRLMDESLIEYTIPDNPISRLQKYRLTDKGRRLVAKMKGDKGK
ncbi:MAG: transcriptional regulator, partial [Clostridia bacterium]|nr:transcriptional regulator [Clostridia bacterium]